MKKLILLYLLLATPLQAATRYVTKTGSGTVCSQAAPCLTIANGIASMASGDTLDIGAGTYVETIGGASAVTNQPPNGGGEGTRTIVQGASAATTIIRPSSGNASGDAVTIFGGSYITIKNLTVDGALVNNSAMDMRSASHHIRVESCILKNSPASQYIAAKDQTTDLHHMELVNTEVGPGGVNGFEHHVYLRSRDNLIEGNTIHDGPGYGVRVDIPISGVRPNNNIIRKNRIYGMGTRGVNIASGDNNQIYNNLIYNNTTAPAGDSIVGGIFIGTGGPTATQVYNNTIYNNGGYCVWVYTGSSGSVLRNNICYSNTNAAEFANSGANTVFSNNFCETAASGPGCTILGNPQFVDTTDFRLSSTSAAVDQAACLGSIFTTDFSGNTRSDSTCISFNEGLAWDIGAQERLDSAGDSLTLFNPNGGTLGLAGSDQTFTWGSTGTIANVRLRYDNDGIGFGSPTVLSASTTNDGSFAFTAPAAGATYRFEVCDAADNDPCDYSDSDVTITAAAGGEFTTILSDNTVGSKIGTPGTDDTYIYSVTPTTNYGTSTGLYGQSNAHSIVRFTNFSAIDPAAVVTSVSFSLWLVDGGTDGTGVIALRRLLRNFNEAGATWNVYSTGSNWTTAGGLGDGTDRVATASASITGVGITAGQFYTVTNTDCGTSGSLCDDVQKRINGTYSDLAWHVSKTGGTSYKRFSSSEDTDGQRPALSITYDVTVPTIEVTSPTSGAHYFPGDLVGVRWTSQGITGNVSAELSLNNGVSYQPTPIIPSHPYDQSDAVWTATGPACEQCKIRVCQGATCGVSAAFKIAGTSLFIR